MAGPRTLALGSLGFLAVSAFLGAIPMILDPSGKMERLPLSLLQYSPFHSFLWPGVILLGANGVLSLVAMAAVWKRAPAAWWLTAFQGAALAGWIAAEMVFFRFAHWMHYLYCGIALLLLLAGWLLRRQVRAA